jgi:hypothetical protein
MSDGALLLDRLRALGLDGVERCRLTENRSVMVSYRGKELRMHRGFASAPPDVLGAVVLFVNGRGLQRRRARDVILAYPIDRRHAATRRREQTHRGDIVLAERLREAHALLNRRHFAGALRTVDIRVSRRLKTRLGYYRLPVGEGDRPEIVIGRRHVRRHGWRAALETLLHEMVHQWQHERGLPVDHGTHFRRKARELGIEPAATRAAGGLLRAARDFLSAARYDLFAACDDR